MKYTATAMSKIAAKQATKDMMLWVSSSFVKPSMSSSFTLPTDALCKPNLHYFSKGILGRVCFPFKVVPWSLRESPPGVCLRSRWKGLNFGWNDLHAIVTGNTKNSVCPSHSHLLQAFSQEFRSRYALIDFLKSKMTGSPDRLVLASTPTRRSVYIFPTKPATHPFGREVSILSELMSLMLLGRKYA